MTASSSNFRTPKSVHITDLLIGILVTMISGWVYWLGNSSLYFSHDDAAWYHDMSNELWRLQAFFGESPRDFRSGLGVWLAPSIPILDLPTLVSALPSGRTNEAIYGALSVASLYFAGWYFSRQFLSCRVATQVAGVIYAYVTFMPTPFMWTRVTLQGNINWLLAATTFALALVFRCLHQQTTNWLRIIRFGVVLSLLSAIGSWSLWVLLVTPVWFIVGLSALAFGKRNGFVSSRVLLSFVIGLIPLSLLTMQILKLIDGTASVVDREVARGSAVDVLSPTVWFFDDVYPLVVPGTSVKLYGAIIVMTIAIGVLIALRERYKEGQLLGFVSAICTMTLTVYAIIHYLFIRQEIEIGPSPGYFALLLFPFWTSLAAVVVMRGIHLSAERIFNGRTISWQMRLKKVFLRTPTSSALATLLVLWALLWSFDNWSLRHTPLNYPKALSRTGEYLSNRVTESRKIQFSGRVMILQSTDSLRDGVTNDVLYPTPRTKSLRRELVENSIPTISTYSHLSSPQFMKAMSSWFANGRSFARLWTVFEDLHVDTARMLGVRYVVTQVPIQVEEKITFVGQFGEDYLYELSDPNLGNFSPTEVLTSTKADDELATLASDEFDARRHVVTDRHVGSLVPATSAKFSAEGGEVVIEVQTNGRSLLVLPIEYVSCMRLRESSPPGEIFRADYLLTGLVVGQTGRYVIDVKRNPYVPGDCY